MRRPLAVLAVALLLGGCWADDADPVSTGADAPAEQAEPDDPPPGDPTTTAAGPPPTFADAGPAVTPDGAPTASELEAVLPPPEVLGDRFEMDPSTLFEDDDSDMAAPVCVSGWPGNHIGEMLRGHDVGGVSAGYDGDTEADGPTVDVHAASLPDAVGHMRDAAAQVEACAAAEPDEVRAGTYVVDGDPGLGDAGIAFRQVPTPEAELGGFPLPTIITTLVAVGDVVVHVEALDVPQTPQAPPFDPLDTDALRTFTEQLVEGVAGLR